MNADGTHLTRVTPPHNRASDPGFSYPEALASGRILLTRRHYTERYVLWDMWSVDVDGTHGHSVTDDEAWWGYSTDSRPGPQLNMSNLTLLSASASSVYPDSWDELNPRERAFCKEPGHWRLCFSGFRGDKKKAERLTRILFSGEIIGPNERAKNDGSRANAFQHSYWTALMTRTAREAGREWYLGEDFAIRHEYDRNGNPQWRYRDDRIRRLSLMDLHNDRVGYELASYRPDRNEHALCTYLIERNRNGKKIPEGQFGPELATVPDGTLIWFRSHDDAGHVVGIIDAHLGGPDDDCG
jgi:hypothetical protein